MDDDAPRASDFETYRIGEGLYGLSLHEIEARILAYEREIDRLKAELDKKRREKTAADRLFNKN
ncbi:MAG: DUF1192 domain-containing protein [Pseudomonadota bacterium]